MLTMRLVEIFYRSASAPVLEWLSPKDLIQFNLASAANREFDDFWKKASLIYYPVYGCKTVAYEFGNFKQKNASWLVNQWLLDNNMSASKLTIINFNYFSFDKTEFNALVGFDKLLRLVISKSLMPNCAQRLAEFVTGCCNKQLQELVFEEVCGLNSFFVAMKAKKVKNSLRVFKIYQCHYSIFGTELVEFLVTCDCLTELSLVFSVFYEPFSRGRNDYLNGLMLDIILQNEHLRTVGVSSNVTKKCYTKLIRDAMINRGGIFEEIISQEKFV